MRKRSDARFHRDARASIEACAANGNGPPAPDARWETLLASSALEGNRVNAFPLEASGSRVTHLRLNIFPDGGVARLRVHGEAVPEEAVFRSGEEVDLAVTLDLALKTAAASHGAFDPTVGPLTQAWYYALQKETLVEPAEVKRLLENPVALVVPPTAD